ncbi:uncharacterized protein BT62DRAFT_591866 [Guyanagaster necrorhizus]|uniref:Uncharacterized protein n=1 Tax=Guyanagaster necrorhizus TaxID=856835 RepID=A0A9P7VXV8_9AGAR|nr:uncharacterized protein BT62DRAFT_591866 [Guyanagaster necrorhizus MCA 3950]KAG7449566.1 hypothetical protein BT62DRAFT_591866 [Guyanagaster necrorhizus MCA 3950]
MLFLNNARRIVGRSSRVRLQVCRNRSRYQLAHSWLARLHLPSTPCVERWSPFRMTNLVEPPFVDTGTLTPSFRRHSEQIVVFSISSCSSLASSTSSPCVELRRPYA